MDVFGQETFDLAANDFDAYAIGGKQAFEPAWCRSFGVLRAERQEYQVAVGNDLLSELCHRCLRSVSIVGPNVKIGN